MKRRVGEILDFKYAGGAYRGEVIIPCGTSGTLPGHHLCRIISGPRMIGQIVDVPVRMVSQKARRR